MTGFAHNPAPVMDYVWAAVAIVLIALALGAIVLVLDTYRLQWQTRRQWRKALRNGITPDALWADMLVAFAETDRKTDATPDDMADLMDREWKAFRRICFDEGWIVQQKDSES